MFRGILVLAVCATMFCSDPVLAQGPAAGADQEARALFEAGNLAFTQGRYENALDHFRRAHELSGRPELLYNIGVTAERLRRDEEALQAFREYLAHAPNAEQRAAVEARIAILEAAIASQDEANAAPSIEATPREPHGGTPDMAAAAAPDITGPLVMAVTGGAVAVVGGVLLGVAASDAASIENAARGTRWDSVSEAYARVEPLSIAGGVTLGVGAALAIGGLIWLALPTEQPPGATVSIRLVPGLGGVSVQGSF